MSLFGGILSGVLGAKAANDSADRAAEALTRSSRTLEAGGKEFESRLEPVAGVAPEVMERLQSILLGGDMSGFYESPDYQYRLESGRDAIEGGAAAGKMLMSGKALKELDRFRQNEASGEFNNTISRLGNLFNTAAPSYQTYAGLPYTMAADKANIQTQIGQVMAQGIQGKNAAWQQGIKTADDSISDAKGSFASLFTGGFM